MTSNDIKCLKMIIEGVNTTSKNVIITKLEKKKLKITHEGPKTFQIDEILEY